MKFLRLFLFFISYASAVEISCEFEFNSWPIVGNIYQCKLNTDPSITSPNTVITSVNGNHYTSTMNNENVQGFYSNSKTIHYMPHGLNQVFPNLILICTDYSQMREIHQKDLQQYPKLRYLNLFLNSIEYLEEDLFKFNTELQFIHFGKNKINQIYPTIFDHLNQLEQLHLDDNQCVNKGKIDRSGVLVLINEVKEKCLPSYYSLHKELEDKFELNFETFSNQLNELSSKVLSLESEIKDVKDLIKRLMSTARNIVNEN